MPDGMVDVGAAAGVVPDAREITKINSGGGDTQEVMDVEEEGGGGNLVPPPNQYVVLAQQRVQLAQSHHLGKANYLKLIHILNFTAACSRVRGHLATPGASTASRDWGNKKFTKPSPTVAEEAHSVGSW
uniref:Uncharacterized protein n=1 Tax=Chromera velia CCMP2878 TaxID=1169474 RepID=A0A0G4FWI4_9ALVE|eukprot:Cvel_19100.t1-p1 / transcript=Cvel_19100.t1 / gene=Cvel_19100 / organism=Chromera_velia_CCMP2878 / gene_product=hypothetical protein / transcript_product=hypothetical protein / location=Cvel_scaffold1621:26818-29093(-) / protein_length=128 / sequence_SO=supercontig / SO=protein_coding / is_pseudo=false